MQKELRWLENKAAENVAYRFDLDDFRAFMNFVEENKSKGEDWVNEMNNAFERGYWLGYNAGERWRGERVLRENPMNMNTLRKKGF